MSWHWKEQTKTIDELVAAILNELVTNGGWTNTDPGYCVTDPNGKFDFHIELEATNKRYLQIEIGEAGTWNPGTHTMGTPKISCGMVLRDSASAANGSDSGSLKMSYDDNHAYIMTDYKANGADYRRCLAHIGLAYPFKVTSPIDCLTALSTLFRGGTVMPTNDSTTAGVGVIMRDISNTTNKPPYATCTFAPVGGFTNYQPKLQIHAAEESVYDFLVICLASNASYPSGGENAGIRAKLRNGYAGGYYDGISHGQTIEAQDGKVYYYFEQVDALNYTHLPTAILVRKE